MKERGKKARKKGTTCFQDLVPPTAHWWLACLLRDRVSLPSLPFSLSVPSRFRSTAKVSSPARGLFTLNSLADSASPAQRRKCSGALNETMNQSGVED